MMSENKTVTSEELVFTEIKQIKSELERIAGGFPKDEHQGLAKQIRDAADDLAAPAGLTEQDPGFRSALKRAVLAATPLHYQLLLARSLGFITPEQYDDVNQRIEAAAQILSGMVQNKLAC